MFSPSYRHFKKLLLFFAIVRVGSAQFVQLGGKLVPSGAIGDVAAGSPVAFSADGNTAIIGGRIDNQFRGAAWVFTRQGGVWSQQKLVGAGASGASQQGSSVAISADGDTVLVGGATDQPNGAVWTFVRTDGVWVQQGNKLVPPGPGIRFGGAALSADGNTALIGASDNSAFVYARNGSTWTYQEQLIVTSPSDDGPVFALSADGTTVVLGDSRASTGWVFNRIGNIWFFQGKLTGSTMMSVALSGDGSAALAGGLPGNPFGLGALAFTRDTYGWAQHGSALVGSGAVGLADQGRSVALSFDGSTALVGGPLDNAGFGATWVFKNSFLGWTQFGTKLVGSGAAGTAQQGYSVALSADGNKALVGAPGDGGGMGAAWVFIMLRVRDFGGDAASSALLYDPILGQSYTALTNKDGTYHYAANLFTPGFDTLRTGDFNGDGFADLIVYNSRTGLAYIGLGKGDGTFSFQPLSWGPGYDIVEAGDIDGDGKTDVALYNSSTGTLYTGISNGTGGFTYLYHLVSRQFSFVRLADFTGNGKADLFLYSAATGGAWMGVGDGSGVFAFSPLFMSAGYNLGDIGDINGDGKPDLIVYNSANGNAATGISNGTGGFTFTPLLFSPGFSSVRLVNDSGDGLASITLYSKNSGLAYYGINPRHLVCGDIPAPPECQSGTFAFRSLFWSPGYDYVEPEDVNGDGRSDIILYNSTSGDEWTVISDRRLGLTYTFSGWGPGRLLAR